MHVAAEIERAIQELGLTDLQIRRLPSNEEETVFRAVETQFAALPNRRCWWENFRTSPVSIHFPDGSGWQHLASLVPSASDKIWLIVESDALISPTFETDAATAQQIISDCFPFEYYLAAKDLRWLLGESDHDVLFAIGEPVEAKLKGLSEKVKLVGNKP